MAGSSKFSAPKNRVSTWLPPECVGMSARGKWRRGRKRQEGDVQEVDDEINQNWTAVYQWTAKKMLRYLEDSECLKVST